MLKDAKFTDLKALVDFMYYGEVSVEHGRLSSLLKTAESLKVKGFVDEKRVEERASTPHVPPMAPKRAMSSASGAVPSPESGVKRPRMSAPQPVSSARSSAGSNASAATLPEGGTATVMPKEEVEGGNDVEYPEGEEYFGKLTTSSRW